jgi:hypothetical protein
VVFEYQRSASPVYKSYTRGQNWAGWSSAPFLSTEAFKTKGIVEPALPVEVVFRSSGTSATIRSAHPVHSLALYKRSVTTHFEHVFGPGPFTILAHLPGYIDDSSLVYMLRFLIEVYGNTASGFFLDDTSALERGISHARSIGENVVLFGAAFGLLALADSGEWALSEDDLVVETGGMKTRSREIDRLALHARLAGGFGLRRQRIRSEYGMCEMLSQCYTRGDEVFFPPPWLRFKVVDPQNPTVSLPDGRPGVLLVFDLANAYSVSALMTSDIAVKVGSGFKVIGRVEASDLRGCNLLIEDFLLRD